MYGKTVATGTLRGGFCVWGIFPSLVHRGFCKVLSRMSYTWLLVELLCLSTFLCSQMSSPHSSQYIREWQTFKNMLPRTATLVNQTKAFFYFFKPYHEEGKVPKQLWQSHYYFATLLWTTKKTTDFCYLAYGCKVALQLRLLTRHDDLSYFMFNELPCFQARLKQQVLIK